MADDVATVLRKAADLIEPEGAWTQGYPARDAKGEYVESTNPKAVCWCAVGAIERLTGGRGRHTAALIKLQRRIPGGDIVDWNDAPGRTQAEVVAALRAAADQVSA